jgi:hypothetical protein
MEGSSQTSDKVLGSKGGKRKFQDIWKSVFVAHLLMIPVTTLIM